MTNSPGNRSNKLKVNNNKTQVTIRSSFLDKPLTLADVAATLDPVCVYFSTEVAAKRFAAQLPKYCNAKMHHLGQCRRELPSETYGLPWLRLDDGCYVVPGVSLQGLHLDKTTGVVNERGEKRRAAFVKLLANYEVVTDLPAASLKLTLGENKVVLPICNNCGDVHSVEENCPE